jgi:hypothetical protein
VVAARQGAEAFLGGDSVDVDPREQRFRRRGCAEDRPGLARRRVEPRGQAEVLIGGRAELEAALDWRLGIGLDGTDLSAGK